MLPPDPHPCWQGDWTATDGLVDLWAHSAVLRTVGALPRLHPWRLGDVKGSRRTLLWCASPDGDTDAVAVLSQHAPEPSLAVGDGGPDGRLLGAGARPTGIDDLLAEVVVGLSRGVADAVADASTTRPVPAAQEPRSRPDQPAGVTRWVGGLARLDGSWLPELAILPTDGREADDPDTRWGTESLDFAARHTVHAADTRFASDVLAPHVTALVLDRVPQDAAVTLAGDALHIWWRYTPQTRMTPGRVAATVQTAALLREAIPSFVLADHPDNSHQVQDRLAARARDAEEYRAARNAGRHHDPTLQRIYDQARAQWLDAQEQ